MITLLPGIGRGEIHSGTPSLWRYAASFPVPVANPVSMGEGCTPLVDHPWRGGRAHFKLEWFAPTGSFKDRGASVMISILRQQGVTRLLEDSSGNGGAAIAAYAAAGGTEAKILVPATTRPGKTVQMRAYGAEVELIPGTRQDTADEAERQAERIFCASHNWQAFFLQETKRLAYELWEDLGFRAPDNVLTPTGPGSNVLGCDIGFGELLRRGEIERLPRLRRSARELRSPLRELRPGRCRLHARGDPSDDRRRNRHRKARADARGPGRHPPLWRRGRLGGRRGIVEAMNGRPAHKRLSPARRSWRLVAQGPVGPLGVVVAPPVFDHHFGLPQGVWGPNANRRGKFLKLLGMVTANGHFSALGRPPDGRNAVLVAVNLDPWRAIETELEIPLWRFGLQDEAAIGAEDLMRGQSLIFHGKRQRVRLDPGDLPFAIWRLDNPGGRRYGQAP